MMKAVSFSNCSNLPGNTLLQRKIFHRIIFFLIQPCLSWRHDMPGTLEEMAAIQGFSEVKLRKYGPHFLNLLRK